MADGTRTPNRRARAILSDADLVALAQCCEDCGCERDLKVVSREGKRTVLCRGCD